VFQADLKYFCINISLWRDCSCSNGKYRELQGSTAFVRSHTSST